MKEQMQEIAKEVELLKGKIDHNFNNINKNREDIDHNTGAVALLHTLNANSNKYFIIWITTFIALIISFCYIIYLHNDIATISEVEEIEQVNDGGGNNNYNRAGGDINGNPKD